MIQRAFSKDSVSTAETNDDTNKNKMHSKSDTQFIYSFNKYLRIQLNGAASWEVGNAEHLI